MIKPAASPAASASPTQAIDPALRKAAQQFEAVFLRQLIGSMRQARLSEDVFGSSATDSFREMADSRTADSMAALGQFGIARMVEAQFAAKAKP